MSKYLDIVRLLIALGTKLPVVWPKVLQVLELIRSIGADLGIGGPEEPAMGTLAVETMPQDIVDAEAQVGQLLAAEGTQAAFDGSRLRRIWKWAEDNGLDDLLIGLLRGLLLG